MATPFILSADTSINELRTGTDAAQIESSLNNLEEAIQTVASQGEPAQRTINLDLPRNVEEAYVVQDRAILYTVNMHGQQTNLSRIFETEINTPQGLPSNQGRHQVTVRAWQNQVNITETQ